MPSLRQRRPSAGNVSRPGMAERPADSRAEAPLIVPRWGALEQQARARLRKAMG